MNILVTGGAGYIGCVLVPRLLRADNDFLEPDYNVTVLDSLCYGGDGLLGVHDHPGFHFIRGDIRDPIVVEEALDGIDVVVHLAALVGEKSCDRDHAETVDVNYTSVVRLLDASVAAGVKLFMLASTCSVYGAMPDCRLDETSAIAPNSLYAQTKAQAENTALSLCGHDVPECTYFYKPKMDVVVMRFATVMGVSPRMRFDLLVNEFVLDAFKGNLLIYGPKAWRPFVHVVDVARAIKRLIKRWEVHRSLPAVVNVGGINATKGTLGKRIQSIVPDDFDLTIKQTAARRDYRVDFNLIRQERFRLSKSLTDAIREVYNVVRLGLLDPDDKRWRNA